MRRAAWRRGRNAEDSAEQRYIRGIPGLGMTNVSRFILYVQAPPVSAENFTVFIDDLGLIAGG